MTYSAFRTWLSANYSPNSVATHMSCLGKVSDAYGNLNTLFDEDGLEAVISELTYSTSDAAARKPNPSRLNIGGNLYDRLPGFKSAVRCFIRFKDAGPSLASEAIIEQAAATIAEKRAGRMFDLETHLQSALRAEIQQLEPGLAIIDDGVERSVESGFIDILARDTDGALVVIELKRDLARRDSVGQILGYMGDLLNESPQTAVRGILVAGDFDRSSVSAAKIIPGLRLVRYRFDFSFSDTASPSIDPDQPDR